MRQNKQIEEMEAKKAQETDIAAETWLFLKGADRSHSLPLLSRTKPLDSWLLKSDSFLRLPTKVQSPKFLIWLLTNMSNKDLTTHPSKDFPVFLPKNLKSHLLLFLPNSDSATLSLYLA